MFCFEKISYEQWEKDWRTFVCADGDLEDCKRAYENIIIPTRATIGSAGYDFVIPYEYTMHGNIAVPNAFNTTDFILTGIRWVCDIPEFFNSEIPVLKMYVRSSLGRKALMTLVNGTGIIDADYYKSENEGHIMLMLENNPYKRSYNVEAGTRIAQGIIEKVYKVDDDKCIDTRNGGIGSTGK